MEERGRTGASEGAGRVGGRSDEAVLGLKTEEGTARPGMWLSSREKGEGKESPLGPPEGMQPLILGRLTARTVREEIYIV